jgi:hypothetical protein
MTEAYGVVHSAVGPRATRSIDGMAKRADAVSDDDLIDVRRAADLTHGDGVSISLREWVVRARVARMDGQKTGSRRSAADLIIEDRTRRTEA